jgi:hypothetical protein
MSKSEKKKKVGIDIQYQIKITHDDGQSKTFEYSHVGNMKAGEALDKDPYKQEINLLAFLQKEFKDHARKQKKRLLAKRKSEKKKAAD